MRLFGFLKKKAPRKGAHFEKEGMELWGDMRERLLSDHPLGKALSLIYKTRDLLSDIWGPDEAGGSGGKHRLIPSHQLIRWDMSFPQRYVVGI